MTLVLLTNSRIVSYNLRALREFWLPSACRCRFCETDSTGARVPFQKRMFRLIPFPSDHARLLSDSTRVVLSLRDITRGAPREGPSKAWPSPPAAEALAAAV